VLLRDNDLVEISQPELIEGTALLRDYFVGEKQDIQLANKICTRCNFLSEYLLEDADSRTGFSINNGIQIVGSDKKNKNIKQKLISQYSREEKTDNYCIPFLECSNIEPFHIVGKHLFYEPDIEKLKSVFERVRTNDNYSGERILLPRTGTRLRAIYVNVPTYYCFDIYSLRLKETNFYPLFTAILNSDLIDYYLTIKHRKRVSDSFPKTTMNDIIHLPIPILYDDELISKISELAKKIANPFSNHRDELNQMIFDLYGLNRFERQRVLDFSLKSRKVFVNEIDIYISSFLEIIKPHIDENISIIGTKYIDRKLTSSFIGIKVEFLSKGKQNASIEQVVNYNLMQLVKEIGNKNIYTTKDKIYGENSLFIIRENNVRNWSKSKAFEDAKVFLTDLLK
jgi:hypothetical protein